MSHQLSTLCALSFNRVNGVPDIKTATYSGYQDAWFARRVGELIRNFSAETSDEPKKAGGGIWYTSDPSRVVFYIPAQPVLPSQLLTLAEIPGGCGIYFESEDGVQRRVLNVAVAEDKKHVAKSTKTITLDNMSVSSYAACTTAILLQAIGASKLYRAPLSYTIHDKE